MSDKDRKQWLGRGRRGFTLIELLMVVVIIGVLATIALPGFDAVRGRAQLAAISSDLRQFGVAQEQYHLVNFMYADDMAALSFQGTEGVDLSITEATVGGWAAVATHAGLSATEGCAMYLGDASPPTLPDGQPHTGGPGSVECRR